MVTIEQIKAEISILDALERYTNIQIKNSNRKNIQTRCPFHSDSSPSFAVYQKSNTFKCFAGCNNGRAGDVINVVRLAKNVNTAEAIKILISDFNLSDSNSTYKELQREKERKRKINNLINERITVNCNALNDRLAVIKTVLSSIKTMDDLEEFGDLYHSKLMIENWLECLISGNGSTKIDTLRAVEFFLSEGGEVNGRGFIDGS